MTISPTPLTLADDLDWLDPSDNAGWSPRVVKATLGAANGDVATVTFADDANTRRTGRLAVTDYCGRSRWSVGQDIVTLQLDDSVKPTMSCTDDRIVAALLDGVSPEVRTGKVRVMAVARRPGVRVKVAVAATVDGMDPVAACVGRAHNRTDAVKAALGGEQVDIVAWHPEPVRLLVNVMQPADVTHVWLDVLKKVALVVAPDHQMSAAVGGGGLNSLLAGQLVGVAVRVIPQSRMEQVRRRLGEPSFTRAGTI